ncbi:glycosyltransferase [Vagococcus fluvialis]|uniref:glycosyltransferase n=1 Tax=Vagococcus fluvialis TaxID=2738 RepID=UPI003B59F441
MKKVLIVNYYFKFGGISSSLNNLLDSFSKEEGYSIDLFLLNSEIDSKYRLPKNVNIIQANYLSKIFFKSFKETIQFGTIIDKLVAIILLIFSKIFGFKFMMKIIIKLEKKLKGYDIAISFSNDIYKSNVSFFERNFSGGCNYFVEKNVSSRKKVAWVHNDPYRLNLNHYRCQKTYKNFDTIVNVSYACKSKFDKIIPEFKDKSIVIGNLINTQKLVDLSNQFEPSFDNNIFNMVTVARIDNQQKRIDKIIEISKQLKSEKKKFSWTIIGGGPDLEKLKQEVIDMELTKNIFFLGKMNNPYPYMKFADLTVLTSDYEAQGMVISESLTIGTPVLSTDFEAAYEFINPGVNGYIEKKEIDYLCEKILELIDNPDIIKELKKNTSEIIRSNNYELFLNMVRG